jgi:hypothetical protein
MIPAGLQLGGPAGIILGAMSNGNGHGGGLTTPWLATRLGLQPAVVEGRRRAGELLGLRREGERDYWYPAWQWETDGTARPIVPRMIQAAREQGISNDRLGELLLRKSGLTSGRRVLDDLLEGRDDAVLAAIRAA